MDLLYPKPTKLQKNLLQFFFFFHVGLETILFRMKVEMEYLDLNFSFFLKHMGCSVSTFLWGIYAESCSSSHQLSTILKVISSSVVSLEGKRRKISIFKLFPRWKWITSNSNVGSVWCVLAFWQSFLSSFRLILENTHRSLLICIIAFTYEGDCCTLKYFSFQFHWIELESLVLSALYHTQENATFFSHHFMKCFATTWNFLILQLYFQLVKLSVQLEFSVRQSP